MRAKINKDEIRKEQAMLLRSHGMSLQKAANFTGLTKSSVRNLDKNIMVGEADSLLDVKIKDGEACVFCGTPVDQHGSPGRPRRFCSDHCRRQYWRLHREDQKRNPDIIYTRICRYCGQPFEIYGKNDRKYCCRDHYIKHFWGKDAGRQSKACSI